MKKLKPTKQSLDNFDNVADLTPFIAGGDYEDLRENAFQEGWNDENPKATQIQGPMTRGRTKQSEDTLQQMVAVILDKAQVEKDEGIPKNLDC